MKNYLAAFGGIMIMFMLIAGVGDILSHQNKSSSDSAAIYNNFRNSSISACEQVKGASDSYCTCATDLMLTMYPDLPTNTTLQNRFETTGFTKAETDAIAKCNQ